jgi:SAM-dependent methyltransferase
MEFWLSSLTILLLWLEFFFDDLASRKAGRLTGGFLQMTIHGSIYDHPKLYDVLFSAEWKREIEFLNNCFFRFGGGSVRRVFEPACGTGRLLWRLGKQGFDVSGLDLNPRAVAFCNRRLRKHGLPETAVVGDMTDFHLERPVDAAFNLVSSFLHLTAEESVREHFRKMSAALRPKGLYILGFHLIPQGVADCSEEAWNTTHGALSLRSALHRISRNVAKRLETVEFRIQATVPTGTYEVVDTFSLRTYTLAQFRRLLADVALFDVVETFNFRMDRPIRVDTETEDVVFVLQKKTVGT